jgi:2-oxoglutarate dehydrogenase complex dehydrogenase (E1) component-like enzyme
MDILVMEIDVLLIDNCLMDHTAGLLESVVMVFVPMVCATAEEQLIVSLILTVLDLEKFVTNNLDQFVDFALQVLMEVRSSFPNVKEILSKQSLLQNQPMWDVIKQSLNTSVELHARSVLTREFLLLILHTHTIVQL